MSSLALECRQVPNVVTLLCLFASTAASVLACSTSQATRLNPGAEPERYRVVCAGSFHQCRTRVKEICGDDFHVIEQESNKPEAKDVEQTGVSSTAPSEGIVDWRGEMVVQCGRLRAPVRLVRQTPVAKPGGKSAGGVGPAPLPHGAHPPATPPRAAERVCVPGVTQACLGPGACSGAQACIADGTGFGACDCGDVRSPVAGAPAAGAPSASTPATPVQGPSTPAPAPSAAP
jgi:hypothetical protein